MEFGEDFIEAALNVAFVCRCEVGVLHHAKDDASDVGGYQEILVFVDDIMLFIDIEMAFTAQYKVQRVIAAHSGTVGSIRSAFFISTGNQMEFFGVGAAVHRLFLFHEVLLSCKYENEKRKF